MKSVGKPIILSNFSNSGCRTEGVKVAVRNVQYRGGSGYRIEGVKVAVHSVQYRDGSGCRIMVL